ncbi:MAG: hypothetical protein WBF53_06790 [Litorimonas sp.]
MMKALYGSAGKIIAVGLGLSLMASTALATPLKIESENIVFYGDVDPELAKKTVRDWEVYRRMIFALSGIDRPDADREKLTVYGFYDTADLQDFIGDKNGRTAGVYTNGPEGPIFLTSVNRKYTDDGFSEQVGLHEYTHHVMHALVTDGFPRWYDEGFANYLSTMQISDDVISVGAPTAAHLRAIESGFAEWISPETVLGAIDRYPSMSIKERLRGGMTSFYAQSWLYVHYLRSDPRFKGTLGAYVRELDTPGLDPLVAFENAHGISPQQFHEEAVKYYKTNQFPVDQYQPKPVFMDVDMKGSRISEAELAHAQLPAYLAFLNKYNKRQMGRALADAQKEFGGDPMIYSAYAALDIEGENYDDAVARTEGALSANPTDARLIRAAGMTRLARVTRPAAEDAGRYDAYTYETTDDATLGIQHLEKVLTKNREDFYSIATLVDFYGKSDAIPTSTVMGAVDVLESKYMDSVNSEWGMDLANIYAKAKKMESACDYAEQVRSLNRGRKKRQTGNSPARLEAFDAAYGSYCNV